jgi:hypothetical protein
VIRALCLAASLAACGCAHHRNQSAYAPPLAPPVYPQPQLAGQPVAFPAPPGAVPAAPVMGAPVMAPPGYAPAVAPGAAAPAMPVMPSAGVVPALPDGSCPPCEGSATVPVAYEGAMQSPPCPPGF